MKINAPTAGGIVGLLIALIFFIWYLLHTPAPALPIAPAPVAPSSAPAASSLVKLTPGIETWYTNDALRFSFRVPDGFTVAKVTTTIPRAEEALMRNGNGDLLLVTALPVAEGSTLTETGLRANTPGEAITNVHEVAIGSSFTGLSFTTDAAMWKGTGTGFWFLNGGYLYEVNTFTKDQELLDFVRSTWTFAAPTPSLQKR